MKRTLKFTRISDPLGCDHRDPGDVYLIRLRRRWIKTSLQKHGITRPLRVLIGTNSLGCGGAEHQVMRLIPSLKELGFLVDHIYYGAPHFLKDDFQKHHISTFFLDRDKMGQLKFWGNGVRILNKRKYDIVHAFGQTANFYIRGLGALARVPVLIAGWRSRFMDDSLKWRIPVSLLNIFTSAWIVNSETNVEALSSLWWMNNLRIYVLPNALPLNDRHYSSPKHLESSVSSWVDGRLIVGAVGRIAPPKNFDLFLDVAKLVHKNFKNACFIIIGGPSIDKQTLALDKHLRKRIAEENLGGFIKMLGRLRNEEIVRFLPNLSILLCTSNYEGCPNAVLEGMRAELPIIMTNCCDTRLLVEPGRNGYVVSIGNALEMAQLVIALLHNSEKRRRFGQHSRELVERYFDQQSAAWLLAQIYLKEWLWKMKQRKQT